MRAPVSGENLVVEVFDTKTQSRDSDVFERFEFRFLDRARLTFERDFFRVRPTHVLIQSIDEIAQLFLADVRRRAATEICEPELPPCKGRHAAVKFVLFDQRVEIDLDLGGVLVSVDLEITEVAALPAEGNMNIETQRIVDSRRLVERVDYFRKKLGLP